MAAGRRGGSVDIRLAREAHRAVIICQGPRNRFQLISWDTRKDELQYGHLVRAESCAMDCDLSPDGELFAYWARRPYASPMKIWVAISRPPFLTALALWFMDELPSRGPVFLSDRLIRGLPRGAPDKGHLPKSLRREYGEQTGSRWDDRRRLAGWRKGEGLEARRSDGELVQVLEYRHQSDGKWTLYWAMQPGKPSSARYYLGKRGGQKLEPVTTGSPYDWDQRDRLILAQGDRLVAAPASSPLDEPTLIADFSWIPAETFPSPDWATKWPRA